MFAKEVGCGPKLVGLRPVSGNGRVLFQKCCNRPITSEFAFFITLGLSDQLALDGLLSPRASCLLAAAIVIPDRSKCVRN